MRSLVGDALKVVNAKNSLLEVVETCNETPTLQAACSKSADFWMSTLKRLHGPLMVLQRGDLESGSDWQLFCEGLVKGFAFKYVLASNGDLRTRFASPLGWAYDIDIDGVLPLPGTHAIWVDVETDGRNGPEPFATHTFFGSTLDRVVDNLSEWIFHVAASEASRVGIAVDGDPEDFEMDDPNDVSNVKSLITKGIIECMEKSDQFTVDDADRESYTFQVKHFVFA